MDTTSIRTTTPEVPVEPGECFACYEGVVYLGRLIEDESGEEVEVIEALPCRQCAGDEI